MHVLRPSIASLWFLFLLAIVTTSCAPVMASAPPTPILHLAITATPVQLSAHTVYVVDPHSGDWSTQVHVVDVDRLQVVRSFNTRFTPEIAFTPDGRYMFVADSYHTRVIRGDPHDVLSVYDAVTGELVHDDVEIPERLLYKEFPNVHPFTFLSRDGQRVFVGRYGNPDVHALRMLVLDAGTLAKLAEYPMPEGSLVPLRDGRLLSVGPGGLELVQPLTGQRESISEPDRPTLPNSPTAWALAASDHLYRLWSDTSALARVSMVDLTTNPPRLLLDNRVLDIPQRSLAGIGRMVLSPDESRLYLVLAVGAASDQNTPTEVWAFDTKTWTRIGVFQAPDPAWHLAVSRDGRQLYTVNPFKRLFSVFDTVTFRELGTIHDLGVTPALIVVPP